MERTGTNFPSPCLAFAHQHDLFSFPSPRALRPGGRSFFFFFFFSLLTVPARSFPAVALSSILNRACGILLTGGLYSIGGVCLAGGDVPAFIQLVATTPVVGHTVKFGVAFTLIYHYVAGARVSSALLCRACVVCGVCATDCFFSFLPRAVPLCSFFSRGSPAHLLGLLPRRASGPSFGIIGF